MKAQRDLELEIQVVVNNQMWILESELRSFARYKWISESMTPQGGSNHLAISSNPWILQVIR